MKHAVIAAIPARRKAMALKALALFAMATALAGCMSGTSAYDTMDGWLIREESGLAFATQFDVIFVQDELYRDPTRQSAMYMKAKNEVGSGCFSGIARVFSPLVASNEDVEKAVKWYLKYVHRCTRPFVFIGEGEGGRLLHAYERENFADLAEKGFMEGFYTDDANEPFVNDEIVQKVKAGLVRRRYRNVWGRDVLEKPEK